jgi:signal transduction histidine kinase
MREELDCVQEGIDDIETLVRSQQVYAQRSSVPEQTVAADLFEDALVLSGQVLGPLTGLVIEREIEPTSPVLIYKHRVLEVLVHLINNARQSMEEAGVEPAVLTLRLRRIDAWTLHFEVQDNGLGIPEENRVKIFGHGFSTKPNGHGFGLHASSNAARELGGSLDATSDGEGQGVTFVLALPVEPVEAEEMAAAA